MNNNQERARAMLAQEERDYQQALARLKHDEDFLNDQEDACQTLAFRHPAASQDILIASQNLLGTYRDELRHRENTLTQHHDQTINHLHTTLTKRDHT